VAGHIGSITIGGALNDAVIRAGLDISSIVINDDVTGSTISALGQIDPVLPTGDLAIARILVQGDVSATEVLRRL
jgi:hypothetical protein